MQRARAGRAVLHLDAVLDDANDHVVADECASGHERLGLLADLGAGGDSGAAAARGRCVRVAHIRVNSGGAMAAVAVG